ncbi:TRAP transporter large permease [Pusillimonas sp. ANT_WB101]|uniref:TRAP transporter large permease n=1 Tax=Pusillimonas sp. ANT_WB101 TaxID=2597356 RepID=UPI0011F04A7E|nr:TRAP transporter large permease [Pusillimonas sp. ANT_WB101]KAA0890846.1 TRAP transporter large permease [Pusillimonas sp. ANT_WB101]
MDEITLGLTGLGVVVLLLMLRIPVGVALGGVAFGGIWLLAGSRAAWGTLAQIPYEFTAHWTLSSIPMFLLMGYVAYYSKITESLFRTAQLWMGRLPGGLGIASVSGAAGFAAVTGSSLAAAAAMGRIAVPEMMRMGYAPGFAAGIVAAAGTIGSMIPPSIIMIVYGVFAEVSIGQLFIAGVVPGILTALFYSIVIFVRVKITPSLAPGLAQKPSWSSRFGALLDVWPFLLLVVGVFGGLFSGVFTPTEAGAVGAALAFLIALLKRALTLSVVRQAVVETIRGTASIFFIAIGAALLTRFLSMTGVPSFLSELITGMDVGPIVLMLIISVLYLFLGMFLDPLGCMLLTLPIVLPIMEAQHLNLIWFGILLVKFLEIGLITPPVGLNVFVIKEILGNKVTLAQVFAGVTWFIVADLFLLLILILVPDLTLFLPHYVK